MMRRFKENGLVIVNLAPQTCHCNKKKLRIMGFTFTFAMIATVFSKTSTVTAFSKNSRFFTFRPSSQSISKNNYFFDCLPMASITASQKRKFSLLASKNEKLVDADRIWDLVGLRKEVSRLTVRCHKKTGKANERLRRAQEEVDRLTSDESVTIEELEKCPNLDEIEAQVEALRSRLQQLNELDVMLTTVKGKKSVLPEHIVMLTSSLEVDDKPPQRQPRGPKKQKGPKNMTAFRLPYRRFYTINKTEIRVSVIWWKLVLFNLRCQNIIIMMLCSFSLSNGILMAL